MLFTKKHTNLLNADAVPRFSINVCQQLLHLAVHLSFTDGISKSERAYLITNGTTRSLAVAILVENKCVH